MQNQRNAFVARSGCSCRFGETYTAHHRADNLLAIVEQLLQLVDQWRQLPRLHGNEHHVGIFRADAVIGGGTNARGIGLDAFKFLGMGVADADVFGLYGW